jgi:CRP-like cAMP-binding protein
MDEKRVTGVLEKNPWFAGLPPTLARDIVRLSHLRRVRNTMLYATGDEPNGLFGVIAGEVHLSHTASGGQLGLLFVVRSGSWIGETSVLDGRPRFLDAFATGRCELLHLSMTAFRQLMHDNPSHYKAFVDLLCIDYRLALEHIVSFGELPVALRLARSLLYFSIAQGESGKPSAVVQLSQEQLGSIVGVSRQALSIHLKNLERQSIISLEYKTIRIHKRAALEQLMKQFG